MARLVVSAFLFAAAGVGAASAEPAPITFVGQATQVASLEGGGANSYGYGETAGREPRQGAVIDLRRPQAGAQAPAQEQGAPAAWLERERVGPPYQANGRWYVPTPEPGYSEVGQASWYGPTFHGQRAANGEVFDQEAMTAAHPTLPLNSLVQVTNLQNGREVIVRVTDRGPFVGERLIDLSHGAAVALDFERAGQARVNVRYLGPAPRRVAAEEGTPAPIAPPAPAMVPSPDLAGGPMGEGPMPLTPPAPQAPTAAPAGAYVVQIGAFSDLDNAQRARVAVEAAGPVFVDTRAGPYGDLYRVRLGPYATREEASRAQGAAATLGYHDAAVALR